MPAILSQKINEQSTFVLQLQFRDNSNEPIPLDHIESLTMTLTVYGTSTIINSRNKVDVKPCVDAQGNFTFTLTREDNVIVSDAPGLTEEAHLLTFALVTNSVPPAYFNDEVQITILNLQGITTGDLPAGE